MSDVVRFSAQTGRDYVKAHLSVRINETPRGRSEVTDGLRFLIFGIVTFYADFTGRMSRKV